MCDESGFGADKEPEKSDNKLITFLVVLITVGLVFFISLALESLDEGKDYGIYNPRISVLALADTSY